jgi:hypothetical protein
MVCGCDAGHDTLVAASWHGRKGEPKSVSIHCLKGLDVCAGTC